MIVNISVDLQGQSFTHIPSLVFPFQPPLFGGSAKEISVYTLLAEREQNLHYISVFLTLKNLAEKNVFLPYKSGISFSFFSIGVVYYYC